MKVNQVTISKWDDDFYEMTAQQKYEYNYERIFGETKTKKHDSSATRQTPSSV